MLRQPGFTIWTDSAPAALRSSYRGLVEQNPLPVPEKRAALRYLLGGRAAPVLADLDSHWDEGEPTDLPRHAQLYIDLLKAGEAERYPAGVVGHDRRGWRDLVAFAGQAEVIAAGGLA